MKIAKLQLLMRLLIHFYTAATISLMCVLCYLSYWAWYQQRTKEGREIMSFYSVIVSIKLNWVNHEITWFMNFFRMIPCCLTESRLRIATNAFWHVLYRRSNHILKYPLIKVESIIFFVFAFYTSYVSDFKEALERGNLSLFEKSEHLQGWSQKLQLFIGDMLVGERVLSKVSTFTYCVQNSPNRRVLPSWHYHLGISGIFLM